VITLSFSTEARRAAAVRELARDYRPEFRPISTEAPSLRTLLLARAMRTNKDS